MAGLDAIVLDFDGVIANCRDAVLLPGAAAFVREAAARVPLGIASGAVTRDIEQLLDRHRLRSAFVAIVGADQTRRSKPAPDPFLEALHRIAAAGHRVEPAHVVAIDDSVWGLVAARTAQLRCVAVADGRRAAELTPHADLVVSGLDALTLDMLATLVDGDS